MRPGLGEMSREVGLWPRWLDLCGLDARCAELAKRNPDLCRDFSRGGWFDCDYLGSPKQAKVLRKALAEAGLVAYYPGLRLACICIRPPGIEEKSAAALLRPMLAEPANLDLSGEMSREVALWPTRLTLDELEARCRGLLHSRPFLCERYFAERCGRFCAAWSRTSDEMFQRFGAAAWRMLRRRLAADGLVEFERKSSSVFVRAYVPGRPRGVSGRARERQRWPSMHTPAARFGLWLGRWEEYKKNWRARDVACSPVGIALGLLWERDSESARCVLPDRANRPRMLEKMDKAFGLGGVMFG